MKKMDLPAISHLSFHTLNREALPTLQSQLEFLRKNLALKTFYSCLAFL